MILVYGFPAKLASGEKAEILESIRIGGKYLVFDFKPNDRRIDLNCVTIYKNVTEGGDRELCNVIIGATAIALNSLYNSLALEEVSCMKSLCNYGLARAYLLEDIIKYFASR